MISALLRTRCAKGAHRLCGVAESACAGRVAPTHPLCRRAVMLAAAWLCAVACTGMLANQKAAFASEAEPSPPFAIIDQAGASWTDSETDITVFDQALLHPGSSGVYRFSVENRTSERAVFTFGALATALSPSFAEPVPVGFSLRLVGAGEAANMKPEDGSAGYLAKVAVPAESSLGLSLEWEWPYEGGRQADLVDTMIGSDGQARLRLVLSAKAEGGPVDGSGEPDSPLDDGSGARPPVSDEPPDTGGDAAGRLGQSEKDPVAKSPVKTGDPSFAVFAVAGASIFGAVAFYARRRAVGGDGTSHVFAAIYRARHGGNRG